MKKLYFIISNNIFLNHNNEDRKEKFICFCLFYLLKRLKFDIIQKGLKQIYVSLGVFL